MRKNTGIIIILACFSSLFRTAAAYSAEPVYIDSITEGNPTLVVLGDSISTGVLANTELKQTLSFDFWKQVLALLFSKWSDPASVHATLSNPDLAAPTTGAGFGLRASLQEAHGTAALGVLSFAKFGARAKHVLPMLENLAEHENTMLGRKAEFIFLMIGGNDFCSKASIEDFKADYEVVLSNLESSHPESRFVIAPLPPVHQLADLRGSVKIRDKRGLTRFVSCETLRRDSCPRIYDSDARERTEAINQVIQDAFQNMRTVQKVYARGIKDWTVRSEELAVDCFHPSSKGQLSIAAALKQAIQETSF